MLEGGKCSPIAVCRAIEGIGRAEAKLKYPKNKGLQTIEDGWNVLKEAKAHGSKAILPHLQLIRSEIAVRELEQELDQNRIEEISSAGIQLALHHDYRRYAKLIRDLLQEFHDTV